MLLQNGMIRPVKDVLDVAQHGVDPEELGILDTARSAARDDRAMGVSRAPIPGRQEDHRRRSYRWGTDAFAPRKQ